MIMTQSQLKLFSHIASPLMSRATQKFVAAWPNPSLFQIHDGGHILDDHQEKVETFFMYSRHAIFVGLSMLAEG